MPLASLLRPIPAAQAAPRELTLRGLVLGALLTAVFTASNIYLGLKIGLTFASSIPAAVISMAVLRLLGRSTILENNMVQTQASAAGTLSSVIFVLPGLLMAGVWTRFPFWPVTLLCAAGGMLGVLFTVPLRRALVVESGLPYPEGTAAAEILRAGSEGGGARAPAAVGAGPGSVRFEGGDAAADDPAGAGAFAAPSPRSGDGAGTRAERLPDAGSGLQALLAGSTVSALFAFASSGLRVLGDSASVSFGVGGAVFRLATGFSLALVGAGYLVGITGGLAMLLGAVLSWLVAVPLLTALTPHPAGVSAGAFATELWAHKVRFIGAGTIGVAAVWTLLGLLGPVTRGLRASFSGAARRTLATAAGDPRLETDLPPAVMAVLGLALLGCLGACFAAFLSGAIGTGAALALAGACVLLCLLFGFLVAAACGYMAGIVGSSASPISGIAIVAVVLVSVLLLVLDAAGALPAAFDQEGRLLAIGTVLFVTAAMLAAATISNDNLQDLKTGQLVGATPWRQQVALLLGVGIGALVITPVLNLLHGAYGFPGAMPRPDMDPSHALAAPQALLLATLARGIFLHQLDWTMILSGAALGVALVVADLLLRRRGGQLPVLAVGIGLYLPPTVSVTLVIGALLSWGIGRVRRRRAGATAATTSAALVSDGGDPMLDDTGRRGVMLASGLIVGESLMGVAIAAAIGASGRDDVLAMVGGGFEPVATILGAMCFLGVAAWFCRAVLRPAAA
ncbi:OPT family oligopeptide transporter [Rhizosaccharibacter radicis]|uniref:Oligopeptide transporter, OPT family n=1 Tax=Rhizosaccharibacter radicis TaxID=2782605 RepID=A0ABT1VZ11_9PROT|nr:oligopeptide transporter, OPT family [Acetobacteraceae bacterium KSS12]